ncbi:DUF2188 domain-containing protein [uncultured Caulobacter sp.]|uniref:DUF2188 domain-containing protein n=1 Tax=uncultured Caulobacter sp. TaxID=158749 RepID=UPI00261B7873|nr:DUF2188 domain-containing protein [uncultured Caulobacter sp.]
MTCLFDVSPYDGGWCVKIGATGEVLFFPGRRRAITEARDLARAWPGHAEVRVRGRSVEPRAFDAPRAERPAPPKVEPPRVVA